MMTIHANIDHIRSTIQASLPEVRDLWFPRQTDIEHWNRSSSLLYVRWLANGDYEIGPRLSSMNAARLCPVIRGVLVEEAYNRTRFLARQRFPRETEFLLAFWGLFVALWGAAIAIQVSQGILPAGWWFWWSILCFFWIFAPLLGRVMGGYHLAQGLQQLKQSIESTPGQP